MTDAKTYIGVIRKFEQSPENIQKYLPALKDLLEEQPWEACIAYAFLRLEAAHNRALYGGMVKLHRIDAGIAEKAIEIEHITRESFQLLFRAIFGEEIEPNVVSILNEAEKIRDKVIHGKAVKEQLLRKAVTDILEYAEKFSLTCERLAKFDPFGDLRGFKGAAAPLEKRTSQLVIKGLGFKSIR